MGNKEASQNTKDLTNDFTLLCKAFVNSPFRSTYPPKCCQCKILLTFDSLAILCLSCSQFLHKQCLFTHTSCRLFFKFPRTLIYTSGYLEIREFSLEIINLELYESVAETAQRMLQEAKLVRAPYTPAAIKNIPNKVSTFMYISENSLYAFNTESRKYSSNKIFFRHRTRIGSMPLGDGLLVIAKLRTCPATTEGFFARNPEFDRVLYQITKPFYQHTSELELENFGDKVIYCIPRLKEGCEKFLTEENKWIPIPDIPVKERYVTALVGFNQQYLYCFILLDQLYKLDVLNEDAGWMRVAFELPKKVPRFLKDVLFQCNPSDVMIVGSSFNWYIWNVYDDSCRKVKQAFLPTRFHTGTVFYTGRKLISVKDFKRIEYDLWNRRILPKRNEEFE